jgi:hypothetical protein
VVGLEAGVEQVGDTGLDRTVAIDEWLEAIPQHRLGAREPAHHHRGQRRAHGCALPGALGNLEGERVEGLDRDARHCADLRDDHCGEVLAQAARRDHDPHRRGEPARVLDACLDQRAQIAQQTGFDGTRPVADP